MYSCDDCYARITGSAPPDFNADEEAEIGTRDLFEDRADKLKCQFPWGTWGFDPMEGE